MRLKEHITITLSILAIVISVGHLYIGVIRTSESILLVHANPPMASMYNDQLILRKLDEGEIAFLNTGSRSAIVTSVVLFFTQPKSPELESCQNIAAGYFLTGFQPSEIKPNNSLISKISAKKPSYHIQHSDKITQTKDKNYVIPIKEYNNGEDEFLVDICLSVRMSTPSAANYRVVKHIYRYSASKKYGFRYNPKEAGSQIKDPKFLYRFSGTIFD